MKKRYVLILIPLAIIIILWSVTLYHSYNSFNNLVLDQIDATEITSIDILKSSNDEHVKIIDPQEIEQIIHEFSDMKLRRSNASDKSTEIYWISIIVNKSMRFGMSITDTNFLYMTNLASESKYSSGNFKITSEFDREFIPSLFK
ncbi:DUF5301 domain-containing protein [Paenibacillus sp. G2S3]|uniref:DUF5301 domain-containing protein n=1 Tax=Paenibacillus sp. G2S3 TaxID=3047872 RepID=UPI0024C17D22|nr:DUF5301 domain-containing protein [Paenibacillus sp. G2S3]WHY17347.1 DUF5301 domain-containing protein [Paenibacillus sp. G2S3]